MRNYVDSFLGTYISFKYILKQDRKILKCCKQTNNDKRWARKTSYILGYSIIGDTVTLCNLKTEINMKGEVWNN